MPDKKVKSPTQLDAVLAQKKADETIAQQAAQIRSLTAQFQQVMAEYKQMSAQLSDYRSMDYRRGHVYQSIDFALQAVPAEAKNIVGIVMDKANDFYEAVEQKTAGLIAEDKAKRDAAKAEAEAELIAKERADAENKDKAT